MSSWWAERSLTFVLCHGPPLFHLPVFNMCLVRILCSGWKEEVIFTASAIPLKSITSLDWRYKQKIYLGEPIASGFSCCNPEIRVQWRLRECGHMASSRALSLCLQVFLYSLHWSCLQFWKNNNNNKKKVRSTEDYIWSQYKNALGANKMRIKVEAILRNVPTLSNQVLIQPPSDH